ncbi:MAG: hypothetical protein J6Q40_06000 [Tidjanibacter sp.]|nr:hypothetical protein [Tidjanibacter sp.]
MKKFFTTILLILSTFISVVAQKNHTTTITVQDGERWWGLSADQTFTEPFEWSTDSSKPYEFRMAALISSAGRYVWSKSPMQISFDGTSFAINSADEKVDVRKGGRSLREAYLVYRHTHAAPSGGKPDEMLYTNIIYDAAGEVGALHTSESVVAYAERLIAEELPAGIMMIPDGWQSHSSELVFDAESYPSPADMVTKLHQLGFKVMLSVSPYIPAVGREFVRNREAGTLLCDEQGNIVLFDTEVGFMACRVPDMATAERFSGELRSLMNSYGVDGFRIDATLLESRLSGEALDNFYSAWAAVGADIPMMIYAPASALVGEKVAVVAGDGTIEGALRQTLRIGLTGYPFVSPTFYKAHAEGENLWRRAISSVALPIATVIAPPWKFGTRGEELAKVIRWRAEQSEFMGDLLNESSNTAEAMMRTMDYMFPKDGFSNCYDHYMLGDKWLIAPPVNDEKVRAVRLPRGVWEDMRGRRYRGPRVVNVDVSRGQLPIFELQ